MSNKRSAQDSTMLFKQAETILSDFSSGNGLLLPEQEDKFREDLTATSKLLDMADVHILTAPSKQISYIDLDDMPLMSPNTGATNRGVTQKGADTRGVTLQTKLMRGQISIADEVVNENIEQDNLVDVVMGLIARKVALQLERLFLNGDSALAGKTIADAEEKRIVDYLALEDGIFKQASSNGLTSPAFSNADLPASFVGTFLQELPDKYQQWGSQYTLFSNQRHFNRFKSTVMHRTQADNKFMLETDSMGHQQLIIPEGNAMIPLYGMSYAFPFTETGESEVTITNRDKVLFMNPKTFSAGFYLDSLRMGLHYDFNNWETLINFELYTGSVLQFPDAVVVGTGVAV